MSTNTPKPPSPEIPKPPPTPPSQISTWSYPTPLDQPDSSFTLSSRVITFNGVPFQKRSDCKYLHDYYAVFDRIAKANLFTNEQQKAQPAEHEFNILRNLFQKDLFALVYFIMKNPLANHPFIIEACKEVQYETGDSLEAWARDHLKTTIISVGRQIQKVLNNAERRVLISSAVRPLAVKIQNLIKKILEDKFLYECFPDILWKDPYKEAPKWTESPEGGLIVKRQGFYKEPTFNSAGLVEGMPTGDHYTDLVCDDIVTPDHQSPEMIAKVKENFEMLENVGTRDRQITVVGTFYRHDDPLVYIMEKTDPVTGLRMFKLRKKTATIDGSFSGPSAFLPERSLAIKRAGKKYFYYCQQLLDPTPKGSEKLNRDHIIMVSKKDLPSRLYKFMLIDGAGDEGRRQDREADAWAFAVIGVEPYRDDAGNSRIFILDLVIEPMDLATAQKTAVDMYLRNGRILKLGIEKVGMSTTEIHICAALRAKKRFLSVKHGNLEILKPGGRTKDFRIESALSLPLLNAKVHMLDTVAQAAQQRLGLEMEKFPAWKDDGLDAVSYVYDVIKNYRFGALPFEDKPESPYDAAFRKARESGNTSGWITV